MPAGTDISRKDPQRHKKQQLQEQPPETKEQNVAFIFIHLEPLFNNQRAVRVDEELIHHARNHPAKQGICMICLSKKLMHMLNSRQIRCLYVTMAIMHKTQER